MADQTDAKIIQFPTQRRPAIGLASKGELDAAVGQDKHGTILTPQIKRLITRILIPVAIASLGFGAYDSYQKEPITITVGCVGGDKGATELGEGNLLSERALQLLEGLKNERTITTVLGEAATEGLVNGQNIAAVQKGMRNADGSTVVGPNSPQAEDKFIDPAVCVTNTTPRGNPGQITTGIEVVPAGTGR